MQTKSGVTKSSNSPTRMLSRVLIFGHKELQSGEQSVMISNNNLLQNRPRLASNSLLLSFAIQSNSAQYSIFFFNEVCSYPPPTHTHTQLLFSSLFSSSSTTFFSLYLCLHAYASMSLSLCLLVSVCLCLCLSLCLSLPLSLPPTPSLSPRSQAVFVLLTCYIFKVSPNVPGFTPLCFV